MGKEFCGHEFGGIRTRNMMPLSVIKQKFQIKMSECERCYDAYLKSINRRTTNSHTITIFSTILYNICTATNTVVAMDLPDPS